MKPRGEPDRVALVGNDLENERHSKYRVQTLTSVALARANKPDCRCVFLFFSSSYPFMRWTPAGECDRVSGCGKLRRLYLCYTGDSFRTRYVIAETFACPIEHLLLNISGWNTCFTGSGLNKRYWTCDEWVLPRHKILQPMTFRYANENKSGFSLLSAWRSFPSRFEWTSWFCVHSVPVPAGVDSKTLRRHREAENLLTQPAVVLSSTWPLAVLFFFLHASV